MTILQRTEGLAKNVNGTLRTGNRLPSDVAPGGPVIGDIWYDTINLALKVWNGSEWVGVASGTGQIVTPGLEIYHPASTPFIDFHRAANPAGDGNADFNVRFINDAANVLRLSTLSAPDSTTGGRLHVGNAWMGSHPVHGAVWAGFGHQNRLASNDYQFLANTNGEILFNSGGVQIIRFFFNGATEILNMNTTRSRFPGRVTVGGNDFSDPENITLTGGSSGISYRDRSDNNQRWVTYTSNSNYYFWDGSTERALVERTNGRFQCSLGHNGSTIIGHWVANAAYCAFMSLPKAQSNAAHYLVLGGGDDDMYLTPSAGNGAIIIRTANNGGTHASFGINNRTMTVTQTIDMVLVALGGGNTVNVQAGGSWQVGHVASTGRFKRNVRSLRQTPERDSGPDSPIFKLRPTRFNYIQASKTKQGNWKHDGVANGDEINAKFPNGIVGLIAEEVEELCPDAVIRVPQKNSEPWDVKKHGLPPNDEDGKPLTEVPGWESRVTGIDNDRLIAYLIDAVQYLKEEIDSLKN